MSEKKGGTKEKHLGGEHRRKVTAIIPAYNEESRIGDVIHKTRLYVDEVIVIDDFSEDDTLKEAERAGANVFRNEKNRGYLGSIKRGFQEAQSDILTTLDGDGQHNPEEIPRLIEPILKGKADLVLGKRRTIPRPSERFLNWLTRFKINVEDSGTGFRALKQALASQLNLKGKCTCGTLVLEAKALGAKILEVPVSINPGKKVTKVAWFHFLQLFFVLKWLIKKVNP